MDQIKRVFSSPGGRPIRSSIIVEKQPSSSNRGNLSHSESTDFASTTILQPPHLHSSIPPSVDPSPGHSRPASISHSVAHPQVLIQPPDPPVATTRRASSFSQPINPYGPTPMYPVAIQTLIMMILFGILLVLAILLVELKKTTAQFRTLSNNGTGSYFRVALYQGGLGSANRPFYTYHYSANSTTNVLPSAWS